MSPADRHWLLTWTTYGTWLPGDERGFVSPVPVSENETGGLRPPLAVETKRVLHNAPRSAVDRDVPELLKASRNLLKGPPVFLRKPQADALLEQFHETADRRRWQLLAVAIMRAHLHVVVGVPCDPNPDDLLRDLKSYGSRRLNRDFGRPRSETWWTESGSKRIKRGDDAIVGAVRYVADQDKPLVVWVNPDCQGMLPGERGA